MKNTTRQYARWILNILIAVIVVLLIVYALPIVLDLFMPFIVGWIIALIANPLVKFLEEKLKIQRKAVSVIVIVLVIGAVAGVGYLIIAKLIQEAIGFFLAMPEMIKSFESELTEIGNNLSGFYGRLPESMQNALQGIGDNLSEFTGKILSNIGTPTIENVGSIAKNIPTIIIAIIICLLSSYAFIAERERMIKWMKDNVPKSIQNRWTVVYTSIKQAVGGYFKAQLIIEFWIYLLLVIGFAILKVKFAVLIAFLIAVLDFLPIFGAGAVMLPWAVIKFLSGDYKMAVGLLVIWGIGQLVRQIIQPKIMGDSIGFDMIPTLILLYVGYKLYGVIGMLLILPVGIIIMNMNKAGLFDTTKNSARLLIRGINNFRRLTSEEVESLSSEDKPEEKKDEN